MDEAEYHTDTGITEILPVFYKLFNFSLQPFKGRIRHLELEADALLYAMPLVFGYGFHAEALIVKAVHLLIHRIQTDGSMRIFVSVYRFHKAGEVAGIIC